MKKLFLICSLLLSSAAAAESLEVIQKKVAELQAAGHSADEILTNQEVAQLLGAIKEFKLIKQAQQFLAKLKKTAPLAITEENTTDTATASE